MSNKFLITGAVLLLIIMAWLAKDLIFNNQRPSRDIAGALGEITLKNNDVEVRENNKLDWERAKVKSPVYPYDSILTFNRSQAQVTLKDSTQITVDENSLVILEPPTQPEGPLKIEIKRGSYKFIVPAGRRIDTGYGIIEAKERSEILIKMDRENHAVISLLKGTADLNSKNEKDQNLTSKMDPFHEFVLEPQTQKNNRDEPKATIAPLPMVETSKPQVNLPPNTEKLIRRYSRTPSSEETKQVESTFPQEKEPPPQKEEPLPKLEIPKLEKPETIEALTPYSIEPSQISLYKPGAVSFSVSGYETWGSISDSQGIVPSRSMLTETIGLGVGYRLGKFIPSLYGEYLFSNQTTPVTSVQNQNASGKGYLLGAEIEWKESKFSVAGSYLFLGQYQLNQTTTLSQTSLYDKPMSFSVTIGYNLSPKLSFLITARDTTYTEWNLGGSNNKVTQINYGIGLRYEIF